MYSSKRTGALSLLLATALCLPLAGSAAVSEGCANVDGRFYPSVEPFVHPPFYNVCVKVETDDAGKVIKVEDNGTGLEGSVESKAFEEKWQSKNKPFWDAAVKAGVLTRFEGKTAAEIEALSMNSRESDAISGATLCGLAAKEAVLNALSGRQGKAFLPLTGSVLPVKAISGNDVVMENRLPEGFAPKVLDIRYGAYNAAEDMIGEDSYTVAFKDGQAVISFKDIAQLKPGKYYVNIVDESGAYRSPHFESGHGEEDAAQAPRFIIEAKDATVSADGTQIVLSSGDMADYMKNIRHVLVLAEGAEQPVEQEIVGHHGTVNKAFNLLTAEGRLNPAASIYNRKDKTETPIFEAGKTYQITVSAFGYPDLSFSYQAE